VDIASGPARRVPSSAPVTLITGGSSGIGAATTRQLLGAGHRLVITGRDAERLERLAKELDAGSALRTLVSDASDFDAVRAAVDLALDAFGRLDNAVANAGFVTRDTLADGDPDGWRAMVLTNLLGPALLVKASLPALKESGGRIVFIGSIVGYKNFPGNLYSATKWAVTALAENTRLLVTDEGVGVTLIAPGAVDTPGRRTNPSTDTPGHVPNDQALSADQIAEAVAWAIGQPNRVDINTVVIRPRGQPY
jgi:NADP-dependent 3-hydroxy acid dehydrogenase YdfG